MVLKIIDFLDCVIRPAPLSEHVRTVQLPVAGCEITENSQCLMYGWGETKGTATSTHNSGFQSSE